MKKLIVSACVAIASAMVFASTVESSNTFGVLKVCLTSEGATGTTGANGRSQYFLGVPWAAVGSGASETAINPKTLVLTTNLTSWDNLYYYGAGSDGDEFAAWTYNGTEWQSAEVNDATSGEEVTISGAGDSVGVSRGKGLLIETEAREIYISGQYASDGTVAISGGTTPSFIAGSLAQEYVLQDASGAKVVNASFGKSNGSLLSGDKIYLSAQEVYVWRTDNSGGTNNGTTGWCIPTQGAAVDASSSNFHPPTTKYQLAEGVVSIPAGRGAWFSPASSASSRAAFSLTTL